MSEIQSLHEQQATNIAEPETQLYKKRWWLMISIAIQALLLTASTLYFGVNNDIFAQYFDISFAAIDWFLLIDRPSFCIANAGFAFLVILNKSGFRNVAIVSGSFMIVGSLCQFIAYLFPRLFWFIYIGNFMLGFMSVFVFVVPTSFAVLWFPDNEIGSAMSIRSIFARLGMLIAFLVPSHLLTPLQCGNDSMDDLHNVSACREHWMNEEKLVLLVYVGVIAVIGILTLIFLIIFAMDQPPKPPTIAQGRLRQTTPEAFVFRQKLLEFLTETKKLFTDATFILLVVLTGVGYSVNISQAMFISQVFRPVFQSVYSESKANKIGSYLIVSFEIGAIIGAFISGMLVNYVKKYVLLLRFYFVFSVIFSIDLVVSYHFQNIPAIFVADSLLGMGCGAALVPVFEICTQHTYPRKPEFVLSFFSIGFKLLVFVWAVIARLILDKSGNLSFLIFQTAYIFVALLLTLVLKPKYRRLEAETAKEYTDKSHKDTQLLVDHK